MTRFLTFGLLALAACDTAELEGSFEDDSVTSEDSDHVVDLDDAELAAIALSCAIMGVDHPDDHGCCGSSKSSWNSDGCAFCAPECYLHDLACIDCDLPLGLCGPDCKPGLVGGGGGHAPWESVDVSGMDLAAVVSGDSAGDAVGEETEGSCNENSCAWVGPHGGLLMLVDGLSPEGMLENMDIAAQDGVQVGPNAWLLDSPTKPVVVVYQGGLQVAFVGQDGIFASEVVSVALTLDPSFH